MVLCWERRKVISLQAFPIQEKAHTKLGLGESLQQMMPTADAAGINGGVDQTE